MGTMKATPARAKDSAAITKERGEVDMNARHGGNGPGISKQLTWQ